jgi:hypothetical protein
MTTGASEIAAARARVEDLLERLARVDLQVVVVAPPDGTRVAARSRARTAADAAGRTALFDEAAAAARDATLRAFARAGFSGTWAATEMAASITRASDRVAAAAAFEEAAMAAVVEDLVDDDTLEVLRATSNELDRSTGMPSPGALSAFTARAGIATEGPVQVATLVAFISSCAVIWVVLGSAVGLVAIALGLAVLAWLAKQRAGTGA